MGNNNNKRNFQIPQINNTDSVDEKDFITKGTYEDRFKVEQRDPKNFYDYIININTFSQKPKIIWNIENKAEMKNKPFKILDNEIKIDYIKDKEEPKKEESNFNLLKINDEIDNDKNDKTVIGILGLGNVGKSYLLSVFTGEELPTGDSIHTKGISVKKTKNLILLDSEGIEAPLTKTNIADDLYPKEKLLNININESDSLIETIARDKKAVESFIQDFIIEKSDILVIVVGQLTLTEQKLINRIVNSVNKKIIYVIHNLKDLYGKEQITEYIENTFKKNVFLIQNKKMTPQSYKGKISLFGEKEAYDKYFIEIYNNSDNSQTQVVHFIMGSNVKNSEAYYFNKTVIDYFRNEMANFSEGKKFDIIEELKDFIIKKGKNYIESTEKEKNPFSEEDIKIENKDGIKCITINNENNIIKRCIMNQLGYSQFYGALFSPNYVCYVEENKEKTEKKLYIDINAPGEGFKFDKPKREEILEGNPKTIIRFTGTKTLKEFDEWEKSLSKIDSGDFRIDIVLDYNKYRFKKNEQVIQKNLKGIVRFIYTLMTDEEIKNNSEMKPVNLSNNSKIKEKKEIK